MKWFARIMYRALVWKERQRARASRGWRNKTETAGTSAHLVTGKRGETLAYWYLRQAGYTMVARNRPARSGAGELDLVGWDGPVLAFIEVKTRSLSEAGPPGFAVLQKQRKRIVHAAQSYMRRLGSKPITYRFDVASVHWDSGAGYRVRLIKDVFKG